jgi:hypothetical protein
MVHRVGGGGGRRLDLLLLGLVAFPRERHNNTRVASRPLRLLHGLVPYLRKSFRRVYVAGLLLDYLLLLVVFILRNVEYYFEDNEKIIRLPDAGTRHRWTLHACGRYDVLYGTYFPRLW